MCPTQMQMASSSNCAGYNFSTVHDNPLPAITLTPCNTFSDLFLTMVLHSSVLGFIVCIRRLKLSEVKYCLKLLHRTNRRDRL